MQKIPIKTHVIKRDDNIVDLVAEYTKDLVQDGDVIVITSKIVSICQGQIQAFKDMKISGLAKTLSKFVTKPPHGEGLGRVEKMQAAINEAGALRILFAAFIGGIGKMMGIHGWFYHIAGRRVGAIDGSDGVVDKTFEPYNGFVMYAPVKGDSVCRDIQVKLDKKVGVAIIDANDFGYAGVWGKTPELQTEWVEAACSDNFLGQRFEQTPIGIIRPLVETN